MKAWERIIGFLYGFMMLTASLIFLLWEQTKADVFLVFIAGMLFIYAVLVLMDAFFPDKENPK